MRCCGTDGQVIELGGSAQPLRMLRCTTCARRQWRVGDRAVEADVAFALLGDAYRAVPRAARVARDRAATRTAARAAVRASRTTSRTTSGTASGAASRTAAPADRQDLAALLQGWTVLGAAG